MILLWMILLPIIGSLVILTLPADRVQAHRGIAFLATICCLLLGIITWTEFPPGYEGFLKGELFRINYSWIPDPVGATFSLGIDGISLVLVNMSILLFTLVVLYSWEHVRLREKTYYTMLLLMTAFTVGVFLARDLLLFYVFWEAMLIPMYFLIGIWGGNRRLYASIKFVLFTLAGSLLMLVSIVVLYGLHYEQFGFASTALVDLYRIQVPETYAPWLFFGFLLAFAIKTPLFPLHTWLPDAHTEAPSGGSVILAGILLKVGIYGFIRLLIPIFPETSLLWGGILSLLAVVGILYGGLVAWAQEDMKKLIAYSSVSHLGFVVLGLFALNPASVTGGILQGAIHGINTGALFLLIGMLYGRLHNRMIDDVGGLATQLPYLSVFLVIVSFASIGLPATNGFVGEFTILVSSFPKYPILTVFAVSGVIVSALYMLRLLRSCVFGPVSELVENHEDLTGLETATIIPLVLIIFWIGLYPSPVLKRLEPSVTSLLEKSGITTQENPNWAQPPTHDSISTEGQH